MAAAGLAAASPLPNQVVRAYFVAELAGTIVLETAALCLVPLTEDFYRILYCCVLLPIRLLACVVAARASSWAALTAVPFAAILLWMGLAGIAGQPSTDQWICLLDGVIVTGAGLAAAFMAPFGYHRNLYATLAILWMLLGVFDFGYALQPYGKWRELNDSLLPAMVIGAFGWIAMSGWSARLRRAAGRRSLS